MASVKPPTAKTGTINIRTSEQQRNLIDYAAATLGKSRSDFILEASTRAAEDVVRDRTFFQFDPDAFDAFGAMLDASPAPSVALRDLMSRKTPWE